MEREYKLACPQEGFFSAELWSFLGATPTEIKLHALYFDTEDALLFTNGVCFRLRREGEQTVAAIKAKPKEDQGEARGFFSRYEWETRAKTWEEGLDRLLEAIEIPEVRKTLETAREKGIIIQTETNFTRQFAHIKRGSTVYCAAYDRGFLGLAPPMPFAEVELELVSGPEEALSEAAQALAARFSLASEGKSKLQRALSLR